MVVLVFGLLFLAQAGWGEVSRLYYSADLVVGIPHQGTLRPELREGRDEKRPVYSCVIQDNAPSGLSLSSGCVLSGTPTMAGAASFHVLFTDKESGQSASVEVRLVIRQALPVIEGAYIYAPYAQWLIEPGLLFPGKLTRIITPNGVIIFGAIIDLLGEEPWKVAACPTEIWGIKVLVNGQPVPVCMVSFETLYMLAPGDLIPGSKASVQVIGLTPDGLPNPGNIIYLPVSK